MKLNDIIAIALICKAESYEAAESLAFAASSAPEALPVLGDTKMGMAEALGRKLLPIVKSDFQLYEDLHQTIARIERTREWA